jgi:hypothetical protein
VGIRKDYLLNIEHGTQNINQIEEAQKKLLLSLASKIALVSEVVSKYWCTELFGTVGIKLLAVDLAAGLGVRSWYLDVRLKLITYHPGDYHLMSLKTLGLHLKSEMSYEKNH